MSITITDPELIKAFRQAEGDVVVTDAEGKLLGRFSTLDLLKPPPGFQSKFSLEEIERRRQNKSSGRPLKDILRDLAVGSNQ